ncbi:hypothetical protein HPB47_020885 [Ixodes persulcatus]|uniref:Uncharacterized protein n=1 Tax=Ixodes persulcatus TaxID=34615 RepID=A0AC60QE89_IXOPE|nr:hypothetical protein HPB47_020885 [Ixodes persulcatus]
MDICGESDDLEPSSIPLCSVIEDRLFLGGRDAAEDDPTVRTLGITHILTADIFPLELEGSKSNLQLLFLQVDDRPEEDLLSHFEKACKFIDQGCRNGGCLVHCYFGVSRSATLVIAYIMQKYRLDYTTAFERVREKRTCIGPNQGFIFQLNLFHAMDYKLDKGNIQYRLYLLDKLATVAKRAGAFSAVPDELKTLWSVDDEAGGEHLKCRKCRLALFPTSKIVPHIPDESVPWWDPRWKEPPGQLCSSSFFVEPTGWLFHQAQSLQGKVLCPKCNSKVGNYNWAGLYCECGACVQPGFHITPGRVDRTLSTSKPVSPSADAAQSDDSNS